ncbi:hypothetical protein IFM89_030489 [Coptis chinensis]|uniref:EF-hand domain-containing protein n=1 Tax=Coptis chinensis TaxID=261450 RepID=A0A835H8M1_9MAGN|nr:hypothetical protein IFM89_030489 [Coptis chinensis]
MYCKCGELDDLWKVVWGGACRTHKNSKVAEYAAQNLLDLDPTSAAGYVQLANVYTAMNKWDQVSRVRQLMKDNKVVKSPRYPDLDFALHDYLIPDLPHAHNSTCSGVLINGKVHVFHKGLSTVQNREQRKRKVLASASDFKSRIGFAMIGLGENQSSKQVDADGNGTIDYDEFITVAMHMNITDGQEHLYTIFQFQYFDKDNSGYVVLEQLF